VTLLALDTSTSATAVALLRDDGSAEELRDDPPAGADPGHATRLLPMAAELVRRDGGGWSSLELIAVGLGPGTFTGLRVGLATARGLASSLSLPLTGVSSLAALAADALEAGDGHDAVLAVIDARRGEVFAAAYAQDDGAGPRRLTEPAAIDPERTGELLACAPGARWLAVGDGAVRYRDAIAPAAEVPPAGSGLHLVRAAAVGAAGARTAPATRYEEVVPDYRRRPDAELALEAAGEQGGGVSRT
jgi:tRNA threonylcarbamoyladenosine biosynthesis protein TsaB